MARLAVLGPEGTFSELALHKYRGECTPVFFESIDSIQDAFRKKEIDSALLPAENMITGTVREAIDMIYEDRLLIQQEIIVPVSLSLAALPGTSEVKVVMSHPVALSQVRNYLKKNYPSAEIKSTDSTAGAFREISEKMIKGAAGIGTADAAKKYNLSVIDTEIEDYRHNETRFLAVGKMDSPYTPDKIYKTSIVIYNDKDYPGLLYDIVKPFHDAKVNMTRIESRPEKTRLGRYIFFMDFNGHREEKKSNGCPRCS